MKKLLLLIAFVVITASLFSQDIAGTWNGKLVLPNDNGSLRVVFHFEKSGEGYKGTLDSPDQNAYGLPLTTVEFKDKKLKFTAKDLGMEYNGTLKDSDTFEGTFSQNGQNLELKLERKKEE